ncbi:MAG: Ig-like domain-containing protein [Ruminococcus sp.]
MNNNTIKKIAIISMALVLCICCITPSFSWYDHNGKNAEYVNAIEYTRESLPVSGYLSNEKLSMTTYKGTLASDGEVSYDEETVITDITAEGSADGKEYKTTCYKSVIKNTSAKDVRVGLYLETAEFGSGGDSVCYGTSDPIWRRITADSMNTKMKAEKVSAGTMRVYYFKNGVWSEDAFYVVAYSNDYNHKLYPMATCPNDTDLFYADIPSTSTAFFVTCENALEPSRDYRRTNEISVSECLLSPTNSKKISLTAGAMVDNKYMQATIGSVSGANIANFVEKLYLSTNSLNDADKGSVALTSGTDYIGSSIAYSSNNTDVATVDASGNVVGKKEGTAVITITVTGANGDKCQAETTVNVQNPNTTLPLVQNILVPKNGEASVCWYIDNKTTNELTDLKLMLTL